MLSVSKKLTKEREEMCRELGRLHESMIELHDKMIMEMQVQDIFEDILKKTVDAFVDVSGSSTRKCHSAKKWTEARRQRVSHTDKKPIE